MTASRRLRVVTYNIHKCRGMDWRVDPDRIVAVLRAVDADIIALQEVLGTRGEPGDDHAAYIATQLGMRSSLGVNRRHNGAAYGNLVLSREAPRAVDNLDISSRGYEPRGCLRVDLSIAGRMLHVFNVHLGTSAPERREQVHKLLSAAVLNHPGLSGHRILLGDFNEWTRGYATKRLSAQLQCADLRGHIGTGRAYPGLMPVLNLDHIYFDPGLQLQRMALQRGRRALLASDHLPLVAEFDWPGETTEQQGSGESSQC